MVNDATALNPDCHGTSWNQARMKSLKEMITDAESQHLKVLICIGYSWPLTPTWLINDNEFQYYVNYVKGLVRKISVNHVV